MSEAAPTLEQDEAKPSAPKVTQVSISHDFAEETQEAKARWFQSLTLEERMELLCAFTDMVLSINPQVVNQKDAEPVAGRILVLPRP